MTRLNSLPPRLAAVSSKVKPLTVANTVRMTGRKLQRTRERIWANNPHCASCGRVVALRDFELDHIVPLHKGGAESDENRQVLCVGCHAAKTKEDVSRSRL